MIRGKKTCSDEVDIISFDVKDVKSLELEGSEARSRGHEESQMEGEGNYFKACILRKARRVHVEANSKSGVYAIPSTIQLTFILRCLVSFCVGTMVICRSLRAFPYGVL